MKEKKKSLNEIKQIKKNKVKDRFDKNLKSGVTHGRKKDRKKPHLINGF